MAKRKPACTVEKTIAGIAQAIHEVREEGESTDRLVGALTRGLAAMTTRVEDAEVAIKSLAAEVQELRKPPRTWLDRFKGAR